MKNFKIIILSFLGLFIYFANVNAQYFTFYSDNTNVSTDDYVNFVIKPF